MLQVCSKLTDRVKVVTGHVMQGREGGGEGLREQASFPGPGRDSMIRP